MPTSTANIVEMTPAPCPFCKNANITIEQPSDMHYAYCDDCHAEGPAGDTEADAVARWNSVAAPRIAAVDGSTLEAVARAICVACDERPDHKGDAQGRDFRWQDYEAVAQSAISALLKTSSPSALLLPEGWSLDRGGDDIRLSNKDGKWCGYLSEHKSPGHRLTHRFLNDLLLNLESAQKEHGGTHD